MKSHIHIAVEWGENKLTLQDAQDLRDELKFVVGCFYGRVTDIRNTPGAAGPQWEQLELERVDL